MKARSHDQADDFPASFAFISESGSSQRKRRRKVSEHVMKEYHRRQRWREVTKSGDNEYSFSGQQVPKHSSTRKFAIPKSADRPLKTSTRGHAHGAFTDTNSDMTVNSTVTNMYRLVSKPSEESNYRSNNNQESKVEAIVIREAELTRGPNPWATIAAGNIDPFSRIPFDHSPETRAILHHCKLSSSINSDAISPMRLFEMPISWSLSLMTLQQIHGVCPGY